MNFFGFNESKTFVYCTKEKKFTCKEEVDEIQSSSFFVVTNSEKVEINCGIFSNINFYFKYDSCGCFLFESLLNIRDKEIDKNVLKSFAYSQSFNQDGFYTAFHGIFSMVPGYKVILKPNVAPVLEYLDYKKESSKGNIIEILQKNIVNDWDLSKLTASTVSGGIDSAAISSILCKQKTNILFCALSTPINDLTEKVYREDFENFYHIKIEEINSEVSQKEYLYNFSKSNHELGHGFGILSANAEVYKYLASKGVNTLILGTGGDDMIGHGMSFLNNLIENDYKGLNEVIDLFAQKNVVEPFFNNWFEYPLKLKKQLTAAFILINYRKKGSFKALFKSLFLYFKLVKNPLGIVMVLKNIIKSKIYLVNTPNYKDLNVFKAPKETNNSFQQLFMGNMVGNNKHLNLTANLYGLKLVYPFLHKNVLDWSQQFTIQEKFGKGYTRNHLREELKDILPPLILNRIHKTTWDKFMIKKNRELVSETLKQGYHNSLFLYIDKKWSRNILKTFINSPKGSIKEREYAKFAYKICIINVWLFAIDQ